MKLKFKNEMYKFKTVTYDYLESKKYVTPWIWNLLRDGGNGELIERLVIDFLLSDCKYSNIKKSPKGEMWDFSLINDETVKVDVRRCGSDSINLGHTSSGLQKKLWVHKAEELENGGYLAVSITEKNLSLYYLSANILLESNFETLNEAKLQRINMRFGLDIPSL